MKDNAHCVNCFKVLKSNHHVAKVFS